MANSDEIDVAHKRHDWADRSLYMELEYKGEVHAELSYCLVGQTFSEISDAPSCVRPAPITPKFSVSPYLICFACTANVHFALH